MRMILPRVGILLVFFASSASAAKPLPDADAVASARRIVLDTFRKEIEGDDAKLRLSDYWKTPRENVLFLGAFNCRYRFSQATLKPISGVGRAQDGK